MDHAGPTARGSRRNIRLVRFIGFIRGFELIGCGERIELGIVWLIVTIQLVVFIILGDAFFVVDELVRNSGNVSQS